MAGDWIPVSVELPRKREVLRIAALTKWSRYEVVGRLVEFWAWVSAESADGRVPDLTLDDLTVIQGLDRRFLTVLVEIGWLIEDEAGLVVPNFERWLSGSAKRRLQERDKKRRQRSVSPCCPDSVPQLSRAHRDKSGTREEESIEYRSNTPPIIPPKNRSGTDPPPSPPDQSQPEGCSSAGADAARTDSDQVAFADWWEHYPRKVGKKAAQTAYVKARRRICRETGCKPAEARERLLESARAFAGSPKGRGAYCPHPATWLNQGRWDDDRAEWQRAEAAGNGAKQVDPFA